MLQETKVSKLSRPHHVWGSQRSGWHWAPSEGKLGALIFIWNEGELKGRRFIKANRLWHSNCTVSMIRFFGYQLIYMDKMIIFKKVYGQNENGDRSTFRENLSDLRSRWQVSWCLGARFQNGESSI